MISALLDAQTLHSMITQDSPRNHIVIIDGSWHLPAANRDALQDYMDAHIPGARFMDLDACSDKTAPYAHALASDDDFGQYARTLGINSDTFVVIYDSCGMFSAARFWWMFHYYGHDRVAVLDGGLPGWQRAAFAISTGAEPAAEAGNFIAKGNTSMLVSKTGLQQNLDDFLLLDARAAPRFQGEAPEPRPHLPSGHMPNSLNVPFQDLCQQDGRMRTDMPQDFCDAYQFSPKPLVYSCGSGVTACILALGHAIAQNQSAPLPDTRLYDGSWSEWADDPTTQKAIGRTVPVKTWFLSSTTPISTASAWPEPFRLDYFATPDPATSKRMYDRVGGSIFWHERSQWSLQDYQSYLDQSKTQLLLLSCGDDEAGYSEINPTDDHGNCY
ncbi:MAG: sulfurtransferase, partial [Pseudomonadota bacterium]